MYRKQSVCQFLVHLITFRGDNFSASKRLDSRNLESLSRLSSDLVCPPWKNLIWSWTTMSWLFVGMNPIWIIFEPLSFMLRIWEPVLSRSLQSGQIVYVARATNLIKIRCFYLWSKIPLLSQVHYVFNPQFVVWECFDSECLLVRLWSKPNRLSCYAE